MIRMLKIVAMATVLGALAACATDPAVKPWWTLKEASFIPIKPGTTKDQVRSLLGKSMLETRFPALAEEVWDYRYVNGTTYLYITEVHFDDKGVVKYYTQYPDPSIYSGLF